jgi:YidC/Oxa1 family membrane protein insertase
MFHTIFYDPIYNLLVTVLTYTPLHDIGAAILIVTLIVKIILLPLNLSALRSQYIMKKIEGEMNALKEEHKASPQEASKKMMELYKREKVNPFASLLVIIIQIPIIFALYRVFAHGLQMDPASLYSFLHFPENLHTLAFGLFDVTQKNITIAVLAGVSSYLLARRQTQMMVTKKIEGKDESFQDQFMKSMKIQLLYVLPVIIVFSAAVLPSALGFYWFINNMITYGQDIYMKNKLKHLHTI